VLMGALPLRLCCCGSPTAGSQGVPCYLCHPWGNWAPPSPGRPWLHSAPQRWGTALPFPVLTALSLPFPAGAERDPGEPPGSGRRAGAAGRQSGERPWHPGAVATLSPKPLAAGAPPQTCVGAEQRRGSSPSPSSFLQPGPTSNGCGGAGTLCWGGTTDCSSSRKGT